MENASKALIIAGAILLSILLISLGIMIFSQASGVIDSSAMDEVAVNTFNQKFTQYEGTNVRGSNVNALISTVIQNNLTNSGDESKQVKIQLNDTTGANGNAGSSLNWTNGPSNYNGKELEVTNKSDIGSAQTGKSYKVETVADAQSGYVTLIKIENA